MTMNGREMSVHKLLALVALSGVLPAALGACNKETGSLPPAEQSMKASPSNKNTGQNANNNMQPAGQAAGTSQENKSSQENK
jgi:hypothetical protein